VVVQLYLQLQAGSRVSSVGVATRLRAGRPGFDSRQRQDILLFSIAPRPALGPTQSLVQWVPGVKRQGREADHSLPSSTEVETVVELYHHSPSMSSWRGA
jgi:hypothetical protein